MKIYLQLNPTYTAHTNFTARYETHVSAESAHTTTFQGREDMQHSKKSLGMNIVKLDD